MCQNLPNTVVTTAVLGGTVTHDAHRGAQRSGVVSQHKTDASGEVWQAHVLSSGIELRYAWGGSGPS